MKISKRQQVEHYKLIKSKLESDYGCEKIKEIRKNLKESGLISFKAGIRIQHLASTEPDRYETMCYAVDGYWWRTIIEALETHYSLERYRVIDDEFNTLYSIAE